MASPCNYALLPLAAIGIEIVWPLIGIWCLVTAYCQAASPMHKKAVWLAACRHLQSAASLITLRADTGAAATPTSPVMASNTVVVQNVALISFVMKMFDTVAAANDARYARR